MDWKIFPPLFLNLCFTQFSDTKNVYLVQNNCDGQEFMEISSLTTALIFGKKEKIKEPCSLKLGVKKNLENARLRVQFDYLYIQDCGVELHVNESSTVAFPASGNKEMVSLYCNTKAPAFVHAQPGHFVLIQLVKKDYNLEAYNFRINVSLAASLPQDGPAFSTLVILGLVMVVTVVLAATLLCKYLAHVTSSYKDNSSTGQGFRIYDWQASGGAQPTGFTGSSDRQNGRYGEENYRLIDQPRQVRLPESQQQLRDSQHARLEHQRSSEGVDLEDTSSMIGFEMPPSYEEALGLPMPSSESQSNNNGRSSEETQRLGYNLLDPESSTSAGNEERENLQRCPEADYMNVAHGSERLPEKPPAGCSEDVPHTSETMRDMPSQSQSGARASSPPSKTSSDDSTL